MAIVFPNIQRFLVVCQFKNVEKGQNLYLLKLKNRYLKVAVKMKNTALHQKMYFANTICKNYIYFC